MFGVLLSNRSSFLGEENWQEYIVAFVLAFPTQIFFPSMTLIVLRHFLHLIMGKVKFWWDSVFSLALP